MLIQSPGNFSGTAIQRKQALPAPHEQAAETPAFTDSAISAPPALQFSGNFTSKLKKALWTLGLVTGGLVTTSSGQQLKAEISPESGRVVQWATSVTKNKDGGNKNWQELSPADWNNVIVGLRVTDSLGELDIHPLRMRLLKEAPTNPHIPARVVWEAMSTSGVLAGVVNEKHIQLSPHYKNTKLTPADIRREISDVLSHYETQVMVDTVDTDLKRSRTFMAAKNAPTPRDNTQVHDLRAVASYVRARIGDEPAMTQISQALLRPGTDDSVRKQYFDTLRQSPFRSKEVESWSVEQVFGKESLQKHEEALKAPPVTTPTPTKVEGKTETTPAPTTPSGGTTAPAKVTTTSTDKLVDRSLKALPKELQSPVLPDLKDEQKLFMAKNIEYLAQRNHPMALPAIAQWMIKMDPKDFTSGSSSVSFPTVRVKEADALVFKALVTVAQKDDKAFNLLAKTFSSHPALIGSALRSVETSYEVYHPLVDAGELLQKTLSARPDASRKLLLDLADGKAGALWADSKTPEERQLLESIQRDARNLSVLIMASDTQKQYLEPLRKIAANGLDPLQNAAIFGLAKSRDTDSLQALMKTASNRLEPEGRRAVALEAILTILAPPEMDPLVAERAAKEKPFSFTSASYLTRVHVDKDTKLSQNVLDSTINPFREERLERYGKWMQFETTRRSIAQKQGRPLPALTTEDKLTAYNHIWRGMVGNDNKALSKLAQTKDFQEQFLRPLAAELDRSDLDIEMALPLLDIIGKSGYRPAAPLLGRMIRQPESFFKDDTGELSGFMVSRMAFQNAALRVGALESLGGLVDPASKDANLPHLMMRDPFIPYQFAAMESLSRLGKQEMPADVRKAHIEKGIGHLKRLQSTYHTVEQRRGARDMLGLEIAKSVYDLGGKDALVSYVTDLQKKDASHPLVRTVSHAMINRGLVAKGDRPDEKLVRSFRDGAYWGLPALHGNGQRGKDATALLFDVGYGAPLKEDPELAKRFVYPDWIRYSDRANWDTTPHATSTAKTMFQTAPDLKSIHTYNISERRRMNPFDSEASQDAFFVALEDALQNQIRPEGDPKKTQHAVANYSVGFTNAIMYNRKAREELLDLLGAHMEALGVTGTISVVSAGNSQEDGPRGSFAPVSSVNTLGSRWRNGKVTQNDSTILVAAADGFLRWLAEFSSINDPLRLDDALELVSAPGYQELSWWKDNGKWEFVPVNGTSFSAPRLSGLVLVAQRARINAGLAPWSGTEIRQALIATADRLPNREDWEGGRFVNPEAFLKRALEKK